MVRQLQDKRESYAYFNEGRIGKIYNLLYKRLSKRKIFNIFIEYIVGILDRKYL